MDEQPCARDEPTDDGRDGLGDAETVEQRGQGADPGSGVVDESEPTRFRVLRYHAGGNLGQIFIALDKELGREVALKQMSPRFRDDAALRSRFLREADINGHLEHPCIVPVYGKGAYADGRPFYAMRLIRGRSLWQAIQVLHQDRPGSDAAVESLGLRQLLGRFIDVCNAIAYAHSRGVLHRDIKPSNVMLGDYGETLVIDWGLAKATGVDDPSCRESSIRPDSPSGSTDTLAGSAIGTPAYMSPEQAAGDLEHMGPTSDVYSLGATLYCVLTGKPPFEGDPADVVRRVQVGDFAPPRRCNPSIDKPLEAICLKAMAREAGGRYTRPGALAADIDRWMADEPVSAMRDPFVRRAGRWARRHRPLIAGLAGLMLTALVALAVATVVVNEQKRQAREARSEADVARGQAEDHLRLGLDVVEQLVTIGDRQLVAPTELTDTREQLLSSALLFIRRFRERRSGDPSLEAGSAQGARRLANIYRLRGDFAQAGLLYDEARALIEDLTRRRPPNTAFDDLMAELLLDAGECLSMAGRTKEAQELFRRANEITEKLAAGSPEDSPFRRTRGRSLYRLAAAGLALGREGSLSHAREATKQLRPLADASRSSARDEVLKGRVLPLTDQIELVLAQGVLAEILARDGQNRQAESELREALDRMDSLVEQFKGLTIDDIAYFHACTILQLARLHLDSKQDGLREDLPRRLDTAIGELNEIVRRSGKVRHYRATLATAYAARSRLHELSGRPDRSGADADAAREILQTLVGQYPEIPDHRSDLAEVLDILGRIALSRGDRDAATHHFADAARLHRLVIEAAPENPLYRARLSKHQAGMMPAR